MEKHLTITRARLKTFLREHTLLGKLYPERHPVRLAVYKAPDRIPYAQAVRGRYRPARVGEQFGPLWATYWFRVDITVPAAWRGHEVHLLWDSFSEACVWKDGVPLQGLTGSGAIQWMNVSGPVRHRFRLPPGQRHTYYIEVACNHLFGADGRHVQMGTLRQAEIARFDRDAWDLLWDYTVIADMAEHLPPHSPRGAQALWTANAMINAVDLDDRSTWPAARRLARRFLAAKNGAGQHNISAIGHAHIDTAWLWPLAETKRKCYRTFSTALRLAREYPGYKFVCSQAQQYAWIQREWPALYAQIKRAVAAGQFIPAGGTWVEPDCNIPSGESLVRQFLHGQRFFRREFGRTCREFWNPDVFGYNGQLPQIMRGAGITRFLTQKLSWNQFNKPHAHTFWWEGIDGSRVLTHFPPADTYNGNGSVKQLLHHVANYKDLERSNESYYLFGYGDGGGGPTWEMLEQLRRCRDLDGLPRVTLRSPDEFFARLEADAKPLTCQVGELYFEYHRGTYTTQAANKRLNRRCEELLHDIEFLGAVTGRYPRAELARLWELVLLNQFHDIIPGSSITEVYRDSAAQYADILHSGHRLRQAALDALAPPGTGRLAVVNPTGHDRTEVVTHAGRPVIVSAPACGLCIQTPATDAPPVRLRETATGFVLENQHLRAVLRRDGCLLSLRETATGRETIAEPANRFVLYDDEPIAFDAWDVDIYHLEKRRDLGGARTARIVERHPLRVAIEFQYPLTAHSRLTQRVSLDALARRLDFDCDCHWHEHHKFLKVEFPTTIRSDTATYEIQFGHVQRPTHFNTSYDIARFEVCAFRWADLSQPGLGLTLVNDSKYGHATHRHVLRLSLLRAPTHPDPHADRGRHRFRYGLVPHAGDFRAAGIVAMAQDFNHPLLLQPTAAAPRHVSFFRVNNPAVVLDTVKRAEDSSDIILRLYEAHGTHARARLTSALPVGAVTVCNLLEEPTGRLAWREGVTLRLRPFQILTLKLALRR